MPRVDSSEAEVSDDDSGRDGDSSGGDDDSSDDDGDSDGPSGGAGGAGAGAGAAASASYAAGKARGSRPSRSREEMVPCTAEEKMVLYALDAYKSAGTDKGFSGQVASSKLEKVWKVLREAIAECDSDRTEYRQHQEAALRAAVGKIPTDHGAAVSSFLFAAVD